MIRCRTCQNRMAPALYGELDPRRQRQFDAHLASCEPCTAEFRELQAMLQVMEPPELPNLPANYWAGYWDRLSARLTPKERRSLGQDWLGWLQLGWNPLRPAWAPLAAAVMLVLTGIYIGRSILPSGTGSTAVTQAAAVFDPAVVAEFDEMIDHYLERSKVVLLGLDNFDPAGDDSSIFNFPRQQQISQDILLQGRKLKIHQVALGNDRLQVLVSDMERILLQLANSEGDEMIWTIQLLQEGIEQRALLLQITLIELGQIDAGSETDQPVAPVNKSSMVI